MRKGVVAAGLLVVGAVGCDYVNQLREDKSKPQVAAVDDATAALEKGIDYYNSGQTESARQWFETLVLNNPSSADGYYYLGLCYLRDAGENPEPASPLSPGEQSSLDAFNRALSINPRHGRAALGIADLYSRRLPVVTNTKRKPPKEPPEAYMLALEAYQKALAIDPKFPETQYRYARFQEHLGDNAEAEKAYKAAADAAATVPEIAPDYYTYYARFLAGQPDRAKDAIEQYGLAQMYRKDDTSLQREIAVLYARIGQAYFESKQFSLAEEMLKKAYGLFPDKSDPDALKAEATLQELKAIRR